MVQSSKQEVILIAAISVFARFGKAKASMAMIAKLAKVSKPLLFHHYRNKESLYQSCHALVIAQFQTLKKNLQPSSSFLEDLPKILKTKMELEKKIPGIYLFYEREHPALPVMPPHPFTPQDLKRFKKEVVVDQFWKTLFYVTIGFDNALQSRSDVHKLFEEFETVYMFLCKLAMKEEG